MKNPRYDFDRETDRDFLREAGKMLQERVIALEIKVIQLQLQKAIDEEIKSKLTGELLVLRRRIFESRQEKKKRLKDLKKKKRKEKINLVHNINDNKKEIEIDHGREITLTSKEIEYDLNSSICPNCGKDRLVVIDNLFEESTEYDVNTAFYILKRHKRKKYKCQCCNKITAAKGGMKLVPGGQFSIQMAVQIACDKFQHHMPLERQRVKMKNAGLNVSVKTLFSLTQHLYNLLYPLNEMNRLDIINGQYICLDESPMYFYNKSKSKGYAWSMSNNIGAYYQFEPTRSGAVAKEMIRGFSGCVITDGYSGYDFLDEIEGIIHAYCWSHMRRYFFDAMCEDENAETIVDFIDDLYNIEHNAQSFADLKYLRKTRSSKIYNDIVSWIDENADNYLPSNLTGKAINYFNNQKEGLTHFLTNEHIPIDNNASERRQRCPVMGRKNFQYFRSIDGADVGMFFYSIIESCKTNGLDPFAYLLEMALRSAKGEELETPYQYASKLKVKIKQKMMNELLRIKDSS